MSEAIPTDAGGRHATVSDVVVAGGGSAGLSAAAINHDLVTDDTAAAFENHRADRERMAVHDGDTAATWWERFYDQPHPHWSGEANGVLVRETADMPPGAALDLGCGEGADAIWLAQQGWTVTAIDIARPALQRARERAVAAGVDGRITWLHHDLAQWEPAGNFDLVSAHYLHSAVDLPRDRILRAAAAVVAPGGVLLVVGHTGPLPDHVDGQPGERFPTADEVLADIGLPPAQWDIERDGHVARGTVRPDGHPHAHDDVIVRIRRHTSPSGP